MSTQGLIISLIGVFLALAWVIVPLLRRQRTVPNEAELLQKQREHLLVYYEQVLRTLRDLEEDYSTGKLHIDDYEETREMWVQSGANILKALDEMPEIKMKSKGRTTDQDVDDAIEAEIARYLSKTEGKVNA